jgi:hypothetical protein
VRRLAAGNFTVDYEPGVNLIELPYLKEYTDKYSRYPGITEADKVDGIINESVYAELWKRGIEVKPGDWLGKVGNRGFSGSNHIHMEVYEYFKDNMEKGTGHLSAGWRLITPLYNVFKKADLVIQNENNNNYYYNAAPVIEFFGDDNEAEDEDGNKITLDRFKSKFIKLIDEF